jgi:uncharacterized protein
MVFLAGPRQCGKTTLAKEIGASRGGRYYSWDIAADRRMLLAGELDPDARLWILDELHKNRRWRNWLKGLYDGDEQRHEILVTGSARLDLYGRGGDSLQGRYFFHRLHPFTLSELLGRDFAAADFADRLDTAVPAEAKTVLRDLVKLGGFPEPFLSGSERESRRWRQSYGTRLVREEVRDLENVLDLDRMEMLFDRCAQVVGSPLSLNALREDLEVAHGTVRKWLAILERLYGVFRVPPFGPARVRAVKKEAKLYFWDWARVEEAGPRLENLVATHLLRLVHWLEDVEGEKCELRYFRTPVGHEVDFVLVQRGRPRLAVEVKHSDQPLDRGLRYLLERVRVPRAFQISLEGRKDFETAPINGCRVRVMPAERLLGNLP